MQGPLSAQTLPVFFVFFLIDWLIFHSTKLSRCCFCNIDPYSAVGQVGHCSHQQWLREKTCRKKVKWAVFSTPSSLLGQNTM